MIWPHQDAFPFRRQIVLGACAVSAIAAALLLDLSWVQRAAAPLVVLGCFLGSYFSMRILLAIVGVVRPVGVAYGYLAFYGLLAAGVVFIVLSPVIVFDPGISNPDERAYMVISTLPGVLGACAGVLATFRNWAS